MDQNVVPDFRTKDFSTGILKGTAAIALAIANDAGATLEAAIPSVNMDRPMLEPTLGQKLFAIFIVVLLIFILIRHPWLIFFF